MLSSNSTAANDYFCEGSALSCPQWLKDMDTWQAVAVGVLLFCCMPAAGCGVYCCLRKNDDSDDDDDDSHQPKARTSSKLGSILETKERHAEQDAHRHSHHAHSRQSSGIQDKSTVAGLVPSGRVGKPLSWDDYQ